MQAEELAYKTEQTKGQQMRDIDPELDDEYDPDEDDGEGSDEGGESTQVATSFGRTFDDLPDGWVTAGGFAKVLEKQRSIQVRPQVIYAAAKNTKTFPAIRHSDGRVIVPIKEALEWWDAKEERVKSRSSGPRVVEPTAYEKAQAAAVAEEEAANA